MILILAVGQRQPDWVNVAVGDYLNRFPVDHRPSVKEVKSEPRNTGKSVSAMMAAEADRLRAAIPKGAAVIALDEQGEAMNTARFSQFVQKAQQDWPHVVFLIGGPDGLDPTLKSECAALLRLSSMTLPHGMVRVMLSEALYRAWSIAARHPYHRN